MKTRTWARTALAVAAVLLVTICCTTDTTVRPSGPRNGTLAAVTTGPHRVTVVVNGARSGPVFQGIGAISGGGGNSRLLVDYPAPERAQILDYLFSPHYGASLQLLKLEIGGGGFSSDGAEPSVEPVKGQLDCGAGYEFWLARQALARNPAIKLYGLQWSAPGWVRSSQGGLWSRADVGYVIDWLRCAKQNGLTVSYVGGWNEHYQGTPVQEAWFVNLRAALNAAGFTSTQIVAADEAPRAVARPGGRGDAPQLASQTVADDIVTDPSFGRAVGILGVHDICGVPTTGYRCVMAGTVQNVAARMGKPLWESELGATPATGTNPALPGPGGLARAVNDAYNQAGITGILVWPLLDAIPPDQEAKLELLDEIRAMLDKNWDALDDKDHAELADLRPPDRLHAITRESLPKQIRDKPEVTEADGRIGLMLSIHSANRIDEWNGHDLIEFSNAVRRLELADGETVTTSGASVIFADIISAIEHDGPIVTLVAGIGLVVMVLGLVGFNRRAIAVLAATTGGALFMVALCALLDLKVNFLDFIALPITLGIGIDYAINIAHRYVTEDVPDVATTLRTSGSAVFVCSLTTMIGYGSLLVSDNLAIRGFGAASLLGEVTCVTSALVIVPALLGVRRSKGRMPTAVARGRAA